MDQNELRNYIIKVSSEAEQYLKSARECVEKCDKSGFCNAIENFIFKKFLIDPRKCDERGLIDLARISTHILISLSGGDLSASDISAGCLSVDTPLTKKIILIYALKEELCAEFEPCVVTEMDTIDSLCNIMWDSIPRDRNVK